MKKIVLFLSIIILTTSVMAVPNKKTDQEQHEENCVNLAKLAQTFMTSKQKGVSILSSLETVNTTIKDDQRAEIIRSVVKDAYSQPNYTTQSMKEDQLNEFTAKYYIGCSEMYK
ncbi:hypothetical protein [Acinetobacter nosocomialis]|uniref:hypothetical protein n=1 Tax=Acinetobacter nosocomialis TaxID=106654 RepID=UPI001A9B597B|nr:hypothetical protein [Acinetobacter nosocomialis]MBO1280175.1 hypothetical protein [Acinetobacter nosocomialis]